jgi:dihydroorotate dehydrogenase (NAD+) catalytic subunit
MADLGITVAGLELTSPVIAGSGESTSTAAQIRACLDAGASAVVAKSTNESEEAKAQLRASEYVLLDEDFTPRPLGPAGRGSTGRGDSLFCRSGLVDEPFERWVETLAALDREAGDAYVVPSLIVGDLDAAVSMARAFEQAGLRWLELNVGAPHAAEAAPGAIRTGAELVRPIREAVDLPLTVKVGGLDPVAAATASHDAGADAVVLAARAQGFVTDLETRRPVLGTFAAIGGSWAVPVTCRHLAKARQARPDACLVGTNGARGGLDVARMLLAGAHAVQLTTLVMTDGAGALRTVTAELARYLDEQGVSARQIVGESADTVQTYEEAALEHRR